jgi:hypothetical protein
MTERRIAKRYRAMDGALAALSPEAGHIGQIHNISTGGLAFRYIADTMIDHAPPATFSLQLMVAGEGVWLDSIPVRRVADVAIATETSFSGLPLRQASLQFVSLTAPQKDALQAYIRRCTARLN